VIRNVVIHVNNEQPLVADLYAMPASSDAGLVCTNVRMTDGKRPTFIDRSASTFFFPYLVVRFIEVPEGALARHLAGGGAGGEMTAQASSGGDEDPGSRLPVLIAIDEDDADMGRSDPDLEIDEDFLQRIRDI
jgi:hypothetical protein